MLASYPGDDLASATWIDLLGPTTEEVARAMAATGLRVPTESEISEIESMSRLAFRDGAYLLSTPLVAPREDGEHELVPVGFVLSSKALVTVRFAVLPSFDTARARIAAQGVQTAENAFLCILEAVVDRSADALERASAECDDLSRGAFRRGSKALGSMKLRTALQRVGGVADRASRIRDALLGVERIAAYVTEGRVAGAPSVDASRVRAIRADVASLTEYEGHLSGKIQFLLDAILGFINIEQNDIVKTLTIASVLGIPPVLIAGVYGMNFQNMPELGWRHGYALALLSMLVTGLLPLVWFKRRGWL
jgi:magnesium transporter